jgi:hypothetical protein
MTMSDTKNVIRTPRSESKTAKAAQIFQAMPNAKRKDVITRFESELGLTSKGASTYYQTCRKNNGLVQTRGNSPTA